jgi:enterobacterial common antigen flippase
MLFQCARMRGLSGSAGALGRIVRGRRGLLEAFGTMAAGTVAVTIVGGVSGVIATRALGPYERGLLATAVVWSSVLGSLVAVGVPQAATYFVGRELPARPVFASSAVAVSAIGGACLSLGGIIGSLIVGGPAERALVIIFVAILPLIVSGSGIGAILGLQRYRQWTFLRLVNPCTALIGVLAIVLLDRKTAAAVATVTAGAATVQLVAVGTVLGRHRLLTSPRRDEMRRVLSYGWRNVVSGAAWLVSYKLDQLVLSIAVAPTLLGLYAVAASFGEIIVPIAASAGSVMLARVAARGRVEVRESLRFALGVSLAVSGSAAVVLFVSAPVAVRVLFGSDFLDAVPSLRILLPGAMALAATVVLADTIRGLGRPLVPAQAELIGALCTGVLLAVLVPPLGIEGAAIASTISYMVVTASMAMSLRRVLRSVPADA